MPFNSLKYFFFLPVVYLVFYFVGERARWGVLLAASLLFYAALKVPYLLVVLILVTITTYSFGIWLNQADNPKAKRALLWGGIGVNLLILIVMKYLPFLSENLVALSEILSLDAQIQPVRGFVAIGVSFYVFQAISYLADIYLDIQKPERHFGYFALYLAFFPKLLQGPIERAGHLIPQLKIRYEFNYDNMRSGMLMFVWGMFKKIVVADRLGLYVDAVYNNVHAFSGLPLLLATYAYAFQIYMDFSGYTDMAIGTARLFNINLTQNFKRPYLSTSVMEFWRCWHISFSRWILDYIFTPLQMEMRNWKKHGTSIALLATFLISGIWHGASWCFIGWGLLHGLFLATSIYGKPYRKRIIYALRLENKKILEVWQIIVTFHLICLAWIFFRANTIADAFYVVTHLFSGISGTKAVLLLQGKNTLIILTFSLFTAMIVPFIFEKTKLSRNFFAQPIWFRWAIYYLLIISLMALHGGSSDKFIYFQF